MASEIFEGVNPPTTIGEIQYLIIIAGAFGVIALCGILALAPILEPIANFIKR